VAAQKRVVVNFHGLGPPPDHIEQDERPYWFPVDRFARIVDEIAVRQSRGHDIAITFDDGNRTDVDIAAPILARNGIAGSFFILVGRLGQDGYLSSEDIIRLLDMKMEIGLHGRHHVDWRLLDMAGLESEVPRAREQLSTVAGTRIKVVGVPFGAYNRRVMTYLKKQGFNTIYTSDGGLTRAGQRVQPRLSLRSDMVDTDIEGVLAGTIGGTLKHAKRRLQRLLKEHVI